MNLTLAPARKKDKKFLQYSVSIKDFDVTEFISEMEIYPDKGSKAVEAYRAAHKALTIEPAKMAAWLLDAAYPTQPTSVEVEGGKITCKVYQAQVPRLLITMDGGLIQNIDSSTPVTVVCLDMDTDGGDESVFINPLGDPCFVAVWGKDHGLNVDPEHTRKVYDRVAEELEKTNQLEKHIW